MTASFRKVSLVSLLISSLSIGLILSASCTRQLSGSDGLNSNGDDYDSLDEKELARWYTNNGYEIVGPNTDPLDMGFFTEWAEGDSITGDEKDREEEVELERSLWKSVHSVRTMDMNAWLHKAATTIFSKKDGDERFARLNVIQPFGCLRSFADNYFNQVVTCIAEGKQSWFNKRDGSLAPFSPPFATDSVATRKLSTNINSWVMRYSMNSFEQMLKGSATGAAQSLEYQLRIGVEGRASAAFSYALFRPDLKIRIHTADGRYLTPIERSLDILANCNDASTAYHDKTCRHTSALAPHKYSGMLFALSEIQGRAAAVLNRPEWSAAKLANEKARYREQMELTLARLQQTESQQGMEDSLDPEVKSFMNRNGVPIKPWAYGSVREKMVAGYAAIAEKWAQKPQIIGRNYVGLIQLPMPEYAKGGACVGCHQQADENFEAGFRPHY